MCRECHPAVSDGVEHRSYLVNKNKNTIQINYKENKKQITNNNKPIKTTSDLLKQTLVVCASPEEENIIESYRSGRLQYFDKIIFKINPKFIKTIKKYNKLLRIRNNLLENNHETMPWDTQLAKTGIDVWIERKKFFELPRFRTNDFPS